MLPIPDLQTANVMIDISLHYARLHSNETIVKKFYGIYNTAQFKF